MYVMVSFVSTQAVGAHTFVVCDKSMQKHAFLIGPKVEKSPPKSVGIDFHSTISAHLFRNLQSVIIGDYFSFCSLL